MTSEHVVPPDGDSKGGPLALSIVSNSRLLREGIELILAPYLAFRLCGQYTATSFPDPAMRHHENHIALVDSGIGRDCAVQWTRFWCACKPPVRVVLLELANDLDMIVRSVESGICGYALENASPQEVAETIRLAGEGGATCSPQVTAELFARLAQARKHKSAASELRLLLTAREYQVLTCVVEGCSNKQIAAELVIELRTVKQHVHNILAKLNLENRFQARRVAAEHGWFDR